VVLPEVLRPIRDIMIMATTTSMQMRDMVTPGTVILLRLLRGHKALRKALHEAHRDLHAEDLAHRVIEDMRRTDVPLPEATIVGRTDVGLLRRIKGEDVSSSSANPNLVYN
jgi:hypothetical protein